MKIICVDVTPVEDHTTLDEKCDFGPDTSFFATKCPIVSPYGHLIHKTRMLDNSWCYFYYGDSSKLNLIKR